MIKRNIFVFTRSHRHSRYTIPMHFVVVGFIDVAAFFKRLSIVIGFRRLRGVILPLHKFHVKKNPVMSPCVIYLSNRPLEIIWPVTQVAQYLPVRRQTRTIQFCCVLSPAPTTPAEHSTLGMWYLHQVPSEFAAQSNRTHRPSQRWLASTLWIRRSTECPSQVSIFRRISRRECRQVCESACSQCKTMTESCPAVADPIGIYRPIEKTRWQKKRG